MTDQTPQAVHAAIQGRPYDLIDVRTPGEFAAVHAVGARNVPLDGLDPAAVVASRQGAAADPIYVICQSGARSAMACAAFRKAGIETVVDVSGGTSAWVAAGLPVERNTAAARSAAFWRFAPMTVAAVIVLFLMPCSPFSVWGSAYCAVTPVAAAAAAPAGFDFTRDVVEASRSKPVVVDFHAAWCPPCRMLGPELEQVAQARSDLALVKIDVDEHGDLAQAHQVRGIPDVRLWRDGREIARFAGFQPKAEILVWIDGALSGK